MYIGYRFVFGRRSSSSDDSLLVNNKTTKLSAGREHQRAEISFHQCNFITMYRTREGTCSSIRMVNEHRRICAAGKLLSTDAAGSKVLHIFESFSWRRRKIIHVTYSPLLLCNTRTNSLALVLLDGLYKADEGWFFYIITTNSCRNNLSARQLFRILDIIHFLYIMYVPSRQYITWAARFSKNDPAYTGCMFALCVILFLCILLLCTNWIDFLTYFWRTNTFFDFLLGLLTTTTNNNMAALYILSHI